MMLFIWTAVIMQAFFPSMGQIAALQAQAYEARLRAELETPAPVSAVIGAASHVARYQMPRLAAG